MQRISFELYCTLNARACTVRTYTPSLSLPYFDQYNSNRKSTGKPQAPSYKITKVLRAEATKIDPAIIYAVNYAYFFPFSTSTCDRARFEPSGVSIS